MTRNNNVHNKEDLHRRHRPPDITLPDEKHYATTATTEPHPLITSTTTTNNHNNKTWNNNNNSNHNNKKSSSSNNNNGHIGFKEKSLQCVSVRRGPPLVIIFTYLSIFVLGVALGFTPFLKTYIDTCREDRSVVDRLPAYFERMNEVLAEMVEVSRSLNRTHTDNAMSSHTNGVLANFPQLANMYIKTSYGIGNNNISISCAVKIHILFIEYSGTKADKSTIEEFNKYCDRESTKKNGVVNCLVSLDLVYGIAFLDKSAFTVIQYRCDV